MQISIAYILSVAIIACSSQPEQPTVVSSSFPVDQRFAANALWDDGLAEVATYASTRVIYGKPRSFDYTMITVKEDFNREFNVKTDSYSRDDIFTVFKVNLFARIPTDNYPYHFLTSLFFQRPSVERLHKLTSSSAEWCGNTFKQISRSDSGYVYSWNSYWDGEGDGEGSLDSTAMFEDQLFFSLRALNFDSKDVFTIRLYPSAATSKSQLAPPVAATVRLLREVLDPAALNDGSVFSRTECWKVVVQPEGRPMLQYWFDPQPPHTLYRFQSSDGRSMRLTSVKRLAYWLSE